VRTLLIGAGGQLGTDLLVRLAGDVLPLDLPELDITREDQLRRVLQDYRPDWVINSAAMTNVDGCEKAPAECFAVNTLGALVAARCAAEVEAGLVYISTDYVFGASGPRCHVYDEDDLPGPVNTYGASKLAGEHLSLAHCARTLIVRTCGLYGHAGARGKGGNFIETMLRLGCRGTTVRVVDDQRLSPTATVDCAARIVDLLSAGARGVVHVAARDTCTWFELAREIFKLAALEVDLRPISSAEYGAPARRPAFSALGTRRLAALGLEACRGWREMLADYMAARPRRGAPANAVAGVTQCGRAGQAVESWI
jgi:dTDP-4-dehydrorhamnose reductase